MSRPDPESAARRVIDHRPRLGSHLLARPRLLARLDAQSPLTVVRAPLGFGKTTLVGQWLARADLGTETVAWLRVRPGLGDAESFWADAMAVLADAGLHLPTTQQPVTHQPALVERAVAAADRPVLLVVDGFENITDDGIDAALLDVLRHASPLRLIACGRSHRRFPPQLFLDIDATVIRAHDLAFTVDETASLLAAVDLDAPPSCVETIQAGSGGWPEPLRAFALATRDSRPTEAELIAAANEVAVDYLRRHLLLEVTRADRVDFALATSLPQEFTTELAELLTGDEEAKSHLDWFENEGVLLATMRDGEPVYRWPDAARHALQAELKHDDPQPARTLHARLARWYLGAGQPATALHHAVQAQDWALVIAVVESSFRALVFAHHTQELSEALLATPMEVVAASPLALAVRDIRLRVPDELFFDAARLPQSLAELTELGTRADAARTLETGYAVMGALRLRGLIDFACGYAARLVEIAEAARGGPHPADILDLYPSLHLQAGVTRLAGGDLTGALRGLWQAYDRAADNPRVHIECDAAGKTALAYAVSGDIRRARSWLDRHDTAPLHDTWLEPMIRVTGTAARLLIALDQLDLITATAALDSLVPPWHRDVLWAYLVHAEARHALHADAAADMLERLDRSREMFRNWLDHGAIAGPLLAAAEVDLLLALGRGNQAAAVLAGPHAEHPLLRVGLARLALLAGRTEAALQLATDSAWQRLATARQRLEMLLIHAIGAQRSGDQATAVATLRRAVDAARTTGSLAAFTTVPRDELTDLAQHVPEAAELLAEPALRAARDIFPAGVTLIELTARELRVLEKLAEGLSLHQTANALVVSYNTVRTHQASLYRKLGSSSRPEAIARARQWGLLS